jgi:putative endonuclease
VVGYVYLLANRRNGTLYVGVTNDLMQRIKQHKDKLQEGFTAQYNVTKLMWFEEHWDVRDAIQREKRIKGCKRSWKIELIEKENPKWEDLFERLWVPGTKTI